MEEFLKPMALSQTALASAPVPPRRINEIVLGKRAVTADTDLRLARYFGMWEGFFLQMQTDFDLMAGAGSSATSQGNPATGGLIKFLGSSSQESRNRDTPRSN